MIGKQDLGRLTFRWLTAAVLTWMFLAALMTATAQQRIEAVLRNQPEKPSYSAALITVDMGKLARKRAETDRASALQLGTQVEAASSRLDESQAALNQAWSDLDIAGLSQRAQKAGCDMISAPQDPNPRLATWNLLLRCWREDRLPGALVTQMKAASGGDQDYLRLSRQLDEDVRAKQRLSNQQATLQKTLQADDQAVQDAARLTTIFAETEVLQSPWLGGGFLVKVPPAMLQVLLAFLSGGFGALLVTLVLVVYPKSALAGAAGEEYGSRLLLGGLISIGVFVILSGGSAVLGTASTLGQGEPNFMTFCAVGVLAGMFSDRVAAWLSERANAFFSDVAGPAPPAANDQPTVTAPATTAAE